MNYSKLISKAQQEAESTDIANCSYEEIISGIQDIDDPNNFFHGLAKINKQLNRGGPRYITDDEDKIKINNAYILDPSVIETMTKSKTEPKEANVNITDFTKKLVTVINTVQKIVDSGDEQSSQIIDNYFNSPLDLESFALFTCPFDSETVVDLLKVMVVFLGNVPQDMAEEFTRLYPFVSVTVGALQYLLKYVENLAEEVGVSFENILWTFYNHNNTINEKFAQQVFGGFHDWLRDRAKEFELQKQRVDPPQVPKLQKLCCECNGTYFVYEE